MNKAINYFDASKVDFNLKELSRIAQSAIVNEGYVIFRNFPIDLENIEKIKAEFLQLSTLIGEPISHDANNSIIWDIKMNNSSSNLIKTYSEHSHEAELHTDSQYSFYPEDMFGLLSLVKAKCGGGLSLLLSLEDIIIHLNALPNGKEIIEILSNTDFPFIVPNVFKQNENKEQEFNYGPILRKNEIRFRIDTFEKSLRFSDNICTEAQLNAYRELKKIVTNKKLISNLFLEPGDLLFINNKTMLHGREEFEDSDRHLLRIRMNNY
ncbi:TauD/TfdA family dioxygenase [bacterium]|nr:TauD/TfdA family dioxygenase [bacterium]